jgi:uncharacterized protein (TIGR00251 family)
MKIQVKVSPNAKEAKVEEGSEGALRVKVDAPAREGKANKRLIEILAEYFSRPKSSMRIVKGLASKNKIVEVQ